MVANACWMGLSTSCFEFTQVCVVINGSRSILACCLLRRNEHSTRPYGYCSYKRLLLLGIPNSNGPLYTTDRLRGQQTQGQPIIRHSLVGELEPDKVLLLKCSFRSHDGCVRLKTGVRIGQSQGMRASAMRLCLLLAAALGKNSSAFVPEATQP
jgi:hypothetical protein